MYMVVFVTVPTEEVGLKIAKAVLEEKLAACVNINKGMRSLYWWEDRIQDESEVQLIIKTKFGLYSQLEAKVKELHPYTVPEIIGFPITCGYRPYLDWITRETKFTEDDKNMRLASF
ncbi:MAG: divalent-cation tolerance protein CutA [Firmicutes bacterium]|nr:divalent-cation tolerance protein CutA [Bacillota bacterium]